MEKPTLCFDLAHIISRYVNLRVFYQLVKCSKKLFEKSLDTVESGGSQDRWLNILCKVYQRNGKKYISKSLWYGNNLLDKYYFMKPVLHLLYNDNISEMPLDVFEKTLTVVTTNFSNKTITVYTIEQAYIARNLLIAGKINKIIAIVHRPKGITRQLKFFYMVEFYRYLDERYWESCMRILYD